MTEFTVKIIGCRLRTIWNRFNTAQYVFFPEVFFHKNNFLDHFFIPFHHMTIKVIAAYDCRNISLSCSCDCHIMLNLQDVRSWYAPFPDILFECRSCLCFKDSHFSIIVDCSIKVCCHKRIFLTLQDHMFLTYLNSGSGCKFFSYDWFQKSSEMSIFGISFFRLHLSGFFKP